MAATSSVHPGVLWAQRQKLVFVTIEVSDSDKPDIKVSRGVVRVPAAGGHSPSEGGGL